MIWWIVLIITWPFAFVIIFGAPYLPTRRKTAQQAVKMLGLKRGDLLIDIGSGDGAVLAVAAEQGLRAVGYEINPFLWLVSRIRTLRYGRRVKIYFRNFWLDKWPTDTAGVYVFLHTRFMTKLDKKIRAFGKPLKVVSYTFKIPEKKIVKEHQALYLYKYTDVKLQT